MMSPNPIPPRNRLLALEQELQSRKPQRTQQRKQPHRQASPILSHAAEAMAVESSSNPTSQSSLPRLRQPPATVPQPRSSDVSPWQVLADRLTQREPIRYSPPIRQAAIPSPDFTQALSPRLKQRSTRHTPPELPRPISPVTRQTPPPVSVAQSSDAVPPDNDPPLGNWQDLAAQIRQAKSPLNQPSRSLQLRSQPQPVLPPAAQPIEVEPVAVEESQPATATAIVPLAPAEIRGALVPQSSADRGTLTRYVPNAARSLLVVLRSPQLQRAIPLLAGFILPCALFKTQFLPTTPSSQVPSTGDTLCVLPKIDSRN